MCGVLKYKQSAALCKLNLKVLVPLRWYISGLKLKPLLPLSGVHDRTGCFCLPHSLFMSPCSDWLTALWVTGDLVFHRFHFGTWLFLVNTAESHVFMFGYRYRRPATYSVTTGCFWMVSYTVLMFVLVLEGQSANVGVPSFSTDFQSRVTVAGQGNVYGVVGSEAGLVPAGWGWEKSAISRWHHMDEEVRNATF